MNLNQQEASNYQVLRYNLKDLSKAVSFQQKHLFIECRNVAQLGSALVWGISGRRFKSCHSDQFNLRKSISYNPEKHSINNIHNFQYLCMVSVVGVAVLYK
jgi:hypothetical protein